MGKIAEQELKETTHLLQAVFDSAPNGIAVMQTVYDKSSNVEDFSILLFNTYTLNWMEILTINTGGIVKYFQW